MTHNNQPTKQPTLHEVAALLALIRGKLYRWLKCHVEYRFPTGEWAFTWEERDDEQATYRREHWVKAKDPMIFYTQLTMVAEGIDAFGKPRSGGTLEHLLTP